MSAADPRTDRVCFAKPFTQAAPVLPLFVCFRFPNGASYAGSVDTMMSFNPEVLMAVEISFCPQREALRWAIQS